VGLYCKNIIIQSVESEFIVSSKPVPNKKIFLPVYRKKGTNEGSDSVKNKKNRVNQIKLI
jgi:hypothetical protein